MSNETILKPITKESMQEFIEQHGNFANGINAWLMARAAALDVNSLNHFQHLVTVFLAEAVSRIGKQAQALSDTPIDSNPIIWQ